MHSNIKLKWGEFICPTQQAEKELGLTQKDCGIFLKESKKSLRIYLVRQGKSYAEEYHKGYWVKKVICK